MSETKSSAGPGAEATSLTEPAVEEHVEKAKRAFALRKYEQAIEHYALALEVLTEKCGDGAPEAADLYFSYGKALLENAISQTAVLGKEEAEETLLKDQLEEAGSSSKESRPFISFSGDAEDDDELEREGDDPAVDLFGQAEAAAAAEEQDDDDEQEGEEADEAEPEDDFNAAWEVLDLARAIYEKRKDEDDEFKLKLADTYIALGDVSLETEKFDQAISDYTEAVKLKTGLLPLSSRQIAEAHYKLSIVLDLTSGRLKQAIEHAEKALDSVEARLAELRLGLGGQGTTSSEISKEDVKGKGKETGSKLAKDESVAQMSKSRIEAEIKDLEELREDLALKVEELKLNPMGELTNAPELVARALDRELNGGGSSSYDSSKPVVVNDLSAMVKKKKKQAVDAVPQPSGSTQSNGKRKAEDDAPAEPKKARVEDTPKA